MPLVRPLLCLAAWVSALVPGWVLPQQGPLAELPPEVVRTVRRSYGPDEIRVLMHSVDLNNDGKPELLLYLLSPTACMGAQGCNLLVFTPGPRGYQMVGDIGPVPRPVRMSTQRTGGWQHLVVRPGSGGEVELLYLGSSYARNPRQAGPGVRPFAGGEAAVLIPAAAVPASAPANGHAPGHSNGNSNGNGQASTANEEGLLLPPMP